jgi:hypothetical protein
MIADSQYRERSLRRLQNRPRQRRLGLGPGLDEFRVLHFQLDLMNLEFMYQTAGILLVGRPWLFSPAFRACLLQPLFGAAA